MSFVHYLTIGRFSYGRDSRTPSLADRVVAHFIPGGLQRLEQGTSSIEPFSNADRKDEEAREARKALARLHPTGPGGRKR